MTDSTYTDEEDHISAQLLTAGNAAKYLRVGRRILYQLIERGEIKAVRSKGAILIEKRSLDEFKEKGTLT